MDPTAAPSSSSRFWVFALIALVVGTGVVVGIVVYGSDDESPAATDASATSGAEQDTNTSPSSSSGPASAEEIAAMVEKLSAETSAIRGLPFLEPVDTTFLTDEQFRERLASELEADLSGDEIAEVQAVWVALELIDPGVSLEDVLRRALGEAVLGFYDPETDELVMRGVELDEFVQSTLVHELTHALDDQHFDLHRPDITEGDDSEAQFGFSGLVEGTATWVENQWIAGLDGEARQRLRVAEAAFGAGVDLRGLPESLLVDLSLPYVLGPGLVEALVGSGGTDAIDGAFLDPPSTGEHLFEPDAYLSGEGAIDVSAPEAEGDIVTEGVVGSSGLYEMLLATSPSDSLAAAHAWGGDRFVAWEAGGGASCIRVHLVGDGTDGLNDLTRALERFAAAHSDARLDSVGGELHLRACAG